MFTAWWWVDDTAHQDLDDRLKRISAELLEQEGPDGSITGDLDRDKFRLLVPDGGRLEIFFPVSSTDGMEQAQVDIGVAFVARDNAHSLSAHVQGLGMLDVGAFEFDARAYRILAFDVEEKV